MKATVRLRTETWTLRSAFLAAVAIFPLLGAVVPSELARGRINIAVVAFVAGAALLWLCLLVLSSWALTRGARGSGGRSPSPRPVLLLPGGVLFVSLAAADTAVLYLRGSVAFGALASMAAALFAASLVFACLAAFANR